MQMLQQLQNQREKILRLAAQYGAYDVRIFGSCARGEENEKSDIDFLIRMEKNRSLLDLSGFRLALEDLLHRNVDVVTETSLHAYIRDRVLQEAKPL